MQNLSESIIVDPNCAGRHMIKTLMQVGAGAMKNLHILLKKGHNIHCIVFYLHKHLSSWLLGLKYLHLRTNLSVIVLKILTKLPPVLSSRFTTSNVINHHSFAFLNVISHILLIPIFSGLWKFVQDSYVIPITIKLLSTVKIIKTVFIHSYINIGIHVI